MSNMETLSVFQGPLLESKYYTCIFLIKMAMNRGTVLKVFDFAQDDLSSSLAFDKIAGDHLVS